MTSSQRTESKDTTSRDSSSRIDETPVSSTDRWEDNEPEPPLEPSEPGEVPERAVKRFTNKLSEADIKKYESYPRTKPTVVDFKPSNGEQVVAVTNVVHFGAKGDAQTDDYEAFAGALNLAYLLGGGTVYVPPGTYYISQSLQIPPTVTLRGAYDSPEVTKPGEGTLIITDYDATGFEGTPFIRIYNGSAVKNLSFYYFNQSYSNPKDYAPTIGIAEKYKGTIIDNGAVFTTVENVMFFNSYYAYNGALMMNGGFTLRNIWGSPLGQGLVLDQSGEFSFTSAVDFDPRYYAECGLYGAPGSAEQKAQLANHISNVATAYYIGRHDMLAVTNVKATGYYKGMEIGASVGTSGTWRNDGGAEIADITLKDCYYGFYVNEIFITGRRILNSTVTAAKKSGSTGIYFSQRFSPRMNMTFANVKIGGSPEYAVHNAGSGQIYLYNCDFDNWTGEAVRSTGGDLYVTACRFNQEAAEINAVGSLSAVITGCTFKNASPTIETDGILNRNLKVDHTPLNITPIPHQTYQAGTKLPRAAKNTVYYADDYGVDDTGNADSTAGIQKALDAAGKGGGGIVYVKGGKYLIKGTLTVPTGVELRGCTESKVHFNNGYGTLFLIPSSAKNTSKATVSLMTKSGIRGIYFAYPNQVTKINSSNQWVFDEYPVTIQSQGDGCWAVHVSALNAYRFIDFGTHSNKDFFIFGAYGFSIKESIFAGNNSGTGVMEECIMTIAPWLYDYHGISRLDLGEEGTQYNEAGEGDNQWSRFMNAITSGSDCFVFGYNKNLRIAFCCTYGARSGFSFIEQNGKYTENALIYCGSTDAVNTSFRIEKAGKLDFVMSGGAALLSNLEKCYIRMLAGNNATVTMDSPGFHASRQTSFRVESGTLIMDNLMLNTSGSTMAVVTGGILRLTGAHLFEIGTNIHLDITGGLAEIIGSVVFSKTKPVNQDPIVIRNNGGTAHSAGNTTVAKWYPYT